MIEKIGIENYEKCYPKRLKRIFRKNLNYRTYNYFAIHASSPILGNIPPEIIKLFAPVERGEKIKQFQNALSQVTEYIREKRKTILNDTTIKHRFEFLDNYMQNNGDEISSFFNSRIKDIVPDGITGKLELSGQGGFAYLYRFSMFKNNKKLMHDKAFKIFYNIEEPLQMNVPFHNNFAEANFWTFLKFFAGHKLDKTQFTKHYISDVKSGYNLTEFVDDKITPTTKRLNMRYLLRLFYSDYKNNKPINEKLYDAGGFVKLENFIDDKVVWKNFKKMYNRNTSEEQSKVMNDLTNLIKNPKTPHRDKIKKAIELFKQYQSATKKTKPLFIKVIHNIRDFYYNLFE